MIERWHVACAASGKAGGFLARGWGSGPTRQLHQVSFDLHEEIARAASRKASYHGCSTDGLEQCTFVRLQHLESLLNGVGHFLAVIVLMLHKLVCHPTPTRPQGKTLGLMPASTDSSYLRDTAQTQTPAAWRDPDRHELMILRLPLRLFLRL